jgi:hypothetical protein
MHRERAKHLIELSGVGKAYAAMFKVARMMGAYGAAFLASTPQHEDAQTKLALFEYATWERTSQIWFDAIAENVSPEHLETLIAFFESDSGRYFIECASKYEQIVDHESLKAASQCESTIPERHQQKYLELQATPAWQSLAAVMNGMSTKIATHSVLAAVREKPEFRDCIKAMCERDAKVELCKVSIPPLDSAGASPPDSARSAPTSDAPVPAELVPPSNASPSRSPQRVTAVDPAHLARIDRLIAVSGFAEMIEMMFASVTSPTAKTPQDPRDAELDKILLGYTGWSGSAGLWRAELASRLTAAEVDALIAYHETEGARAVVACERRVSEPSMLATCPMLLGDEDRRLHDAFAESPANRAWVRSTREAMLPVFNQALCLGLEREPAVKARLQDACRRDPHDVCALVRPDDGRSDDDRQALEFGLNACPGLANDGSWEQ